MGRPWWRGVRTDPIHARDINAWNSTEFISVRAMDRGGIFDSRIGIGLWTRRAERGPELIREIVLDTETTGLNPEEGHRIVEIGCVELSNHVPTGNTYHQFVNPERDIPEDAQRIHKLGAEFLSGQPRFSEICDQFVGFIGDSRLIMHNAPFDMGFLNSEFAAAGIHPIPGDRAIDTLEMARARFPGVSNSLDALCRRFGIDNSTRADAHGALIDAELLAAVYLELVGGRQPDLELVFNAGVVLAPGMVVPEPGKARKRPGERPVLLSREEQEAHKEFVVSLGDDSVWKKRYGYPAHADRSGTTEPESA